MPVEAKARAPLDAVDTHAVAAEVVELLEPGDVCLTLGAGDLVTLADELLPLLENR